MDFDPAEASACHGGIRCSSDACRPHSALSGCPSSGPSHGSDAVSRRMLSGFPPHRWLRIPDRQPARIAVSHSHMKPDRDRVRELPSSGPAIRSTTRTVPQGPSSAPAHPLGRQWTVGNWDGLREEEGGPGTPDRGGDARCRKAGGPIRVPVDPAPLSPSGRQWVFRRPSNTQIGEKAPPNDESIKDTPPAPGARADVARQQQPRKGETK